MGRFKNLLLLKLFLWYVPQLSGASILWGIATILWGQPLGSGCLMAARSFRFISVAQSCPTLCEPMDCSMPGFPVCRHLPEFAQTRVYWVSDAIQPSHLLSSPSLPAFNLSQHQGFCFCFPNESVHHIRWPKYWSFSFGISPSKDYSGLISFRID